MVAAPITIFDSDTIPRDRRAELEAAVVAAGRHLQKLFEGWIVATPDGNAAGGTAATIAPNRDGVGMFHGLTAPVPIP